MTPDIAGADLMVEKLRLAKIDFFSPSIAQRDGSSSFQLELPELCWVGKLEKVSLLVQGHSQPLPLFWVSSGPEE